MKNLYNIFIALGIIGLAVPASARHPYYTCDTPQVVEATEEQCNLCLNRYWQDGLCYPSEQCSSNEETICPEGLNRCLCVPEGYSWDCGTKDCVTCAPGDSIAYCDDATGTCSCFKIEECPNEECCTLFDGEWFGEDYWAICKEKGTTLACGHWRSGGRRCKFCSASQGQAVCPKEEHDYTYWGECQCVPDGVDYACSDVTCITCDEGYTPMCSTDWSCQCFNDEYEKGLCNKDKCISCYNDAPEDMTPEEAEDEGYMMEEPYCSEEGECICGWYKSDYYDVACNKRHCIECSTNRMLAVLGVKFIADCPNETGNCVCKREGYETACTEDGEYCISCSTGSQAICGKEGGCICVPEDHTYACTDSDRWYNCIVCSSDKGIAKCDDSGCVCVPEGTSFACDDSETCKVCTAEEGKATCGNRQCFCVPTGSNYACTPYNYTLDEQAPCKVCTAEEGKAICSNNECICDNGGRGACSTSECISCGVGETAQCSSNGSCTCVPKGWNFACGSSKCISCEVGETAQCSSNGSCICVPDEWSSACSTSQCIGCETGYKALCSTEGSCICVPDNATGSTCGYNQCTYCTGVGEIAKCSNWGTCICAPSSENSDCSSWDCHSCTPPYRPGCVPGGCYNRCCYDGRCY